MTVTEAYRESKWGDCIELKRSSHTVRFHRRQGDMYDFCEFVRLLNSITMIDNNWEIAPGEK